MNRNELRQRLISVLLQADGPLSLRQLTAECGATAEALCPALVEMAADGQVIGGPLLTDRPGVCYRWAARWAQESRTATAAHKEALRGAIDLKEILPAGKLEIDAEPVQAFHDCIIHDYTPPRDKRLMVFFQCSVRRPFSTSPSHASMRRAIWVATGFDPAGDFALCPVHVVVLASRIGPVPYDLEDVYPANVRSGGVKHFRPEHYARVLPVLAERMADYITVHAGRYDRMASFTQGRYAEVMQQAAERAGVEFPIFPRKGGPRILAMGGSPPRTYWARCWIQLYREIVGWLSPAAQARAQRRLAATDVQYE